MSESYGKQGKQTQRYYTPVVMHRRSCEIKKLIWVRARYMYQTIIIFILYENDIINK